MEVPNWQTVPWSGFTIPVRAMKSTRSSQACSVRRDESIPRQVPERSSAVIIPG